MPGWVRGSPIAFLCVFPMSGNSFGLDYYWSTGADNYAPGRYSSAMETCLTIVDTMNSIDTSYYISFYGLTYWSPDGRLCGTFNTSRYIDNQFPGQAFVVTLRGDSCPEGKVLDPTGWRCESKFESRDAKQRGNTSDNTCPIGNADEFGGYLNFAIGNGYQAESDYNSNGISPVAFSRHYNSSSGLWIHTYSAHLVVDATSVTLVRADGLQSTFFISGENYAPELDELGVLSKSGSEWIYKSASNEVMKFDGSGKITEIVNSSGLKQTLTYGTVNNLVTGLVSDSFGNSLSFTQYADFRPGEMHTAGLDVAYVYDVNGRLAQANFTRNGQTQSRIYHYDAPSSQLLLLTGITNERGIRSTTWAYDTQGRIISSEQANGAGKTLITYNPDGSSTVANELGKKTTYRYQVIQGVKHITAVEGEPSPNCPASNSTFTYNDRGQVLTQTDAKGFITTYTYNDRGLETSRTEATGTPQARTTTTTWHPTFFLPLTVTEGGQVTTYTYDAQGRQTSRTQTAL